MTLDNLMMKHATHDTLLGTTIYINVRMVVAIVMLLLCRLVVLMM